MSENTINMTVLEGGAEPTNEKPYKFRKLEAGDVFLMFKILSKIGINEFADCLGKDSVKSLLTAKKDDAANMIQQVGIVAVLEAVNVILSNLPRCENEIFEMLARTSNLTEEQVRHLGFAEFAEMVVDFAKKDEFADFIKVASLLFK